MSKNERRSEILRSAAYIVRTDGVLNLTIEAAARHAGISKGGLLHHYPSKEALISGMVQYLMEDYQSNIKKNAIQDTLNGGKGSWTRSFIKETFEQSTSDKHLDAGIMAAAATNRDLLKPIQEAYDQWQSKIDHDGLDYINATILRLAVDGLWLSDFFGLAPLEDDRRQRILEKLIELTMEDQ